MSYTKERDQPWDLIVENERMNHSEKASCKPPTVGHKGSKLGPFRPSTGSFLQYSRVQKRVELNSECIRLVSVDVKLKSHVSD